MIETKTNINQIANNWEDNGRTFIDVVNERYNTTDAELTDEGLYVAGRYAGPEEVAELITWLKLNNYA